MQRKLSNASQKLLHKANEVANSIVSDKIRSELLTLLISDTDKKTIKTYLEVAKELTLPPEYFSNISLIKLIIYKALTKTLTVEQYRELREKRSSIFSTLLQEQYTKEDRIQRAKDAAAANTHNSTDRAGFKRDSLLEQGKFAWQQEYAIYFDELCTKPDYKWQTGSHKGKLNHKKLAISMTEKFNKPDKNVIFTSDIIANFLSDRHRRGYFGAKKKDPITKQ